VFVSLLVRCWIEEPLDAHDFEGHGLLAERFDTAVATGEMLTSFGSRRS
jgi:L-alanine-DL-glutamate epimerase-like enolase superfamily enzyme